jgi:hypothetical protein
MEELDVNTHLLKEDLFVLFKNQLKKDFESSGLNADFVDSLPKDFDALKQRVISVIEPLINSNSSLLAILVYRVDISELQLAKYQKKNPLMEYKELLAELIIKRVLQKIILRKHFQ